MEKINLKEFNKNFEILLSYAMKHILEEDWFGYDKGLVIDDVFNTMQHFVIATQKCLEYQAILKEYENLEQKDKKGVFLDA